MGSLSQLTRLSKTFLPSLQKPDLGLYGHSYGCCRNPPGTAQVPYLTLIETNPQICVLPEHLKLSPNTNRPDKYYFG